MVPLHNNLVHHTPTDLPELSEASIMTWSGYAANKLYVVLKPFQISGMHAYVSKRDLIVIQATGNGKSVCFQLPALMLKPGQYGILIVPTFALGQDHLQTLPKLKITAVFFE